MISYTILTQSDIFWKWYFADYGITSKLLIIILLIFILLMIERWEEDLTMTEMDSFEIFLTGTSNDDVIEYVVSERFKDAEGNVIPWKLKPISAEKNNELRKSCTIKSGKKNGQTFDEEKYGAKLCAETVVYPNLKLAAFQDSAGVKTPEALLGKILLAGEYDQLQAKVLVVNGYGFSMDELVEQAKN